MTVTGMTYLIVCPLVFLAGLIDAIGGGGGLVSLPAYFLAGLPAHLAVGTNKISSVMGTSVATWRLCRSGYASWKVAIPSVIFAIIGSSIGARISLLIDESILLYVMVAILPVVAFVVFNRKLFGDGEESVAITGKTYVVASLAAFIIGGYDGFYGPGTGTFLIISFTVLAGMNIKSANAQTKIINLTTGITSLVVFLLNGQVVVGLGLAAGACNMVGGYIGAGLMMKNGARIVRPTVIIVLILLVLKVLSPIVGF